MRLPKIFFHIFFCTMSWKSLNEFLAKLIAGCWQSNAKAGTMYTPAGGNIPIKYNCHVEEHGTSSKRLKLEL